MLKIRLFKAFIALMLMPVLSFAQITSGNITGTVKDTKGETLAGATVEAVHEPSGTKYKTVSMVNGKFNLPSLRVGGPYKITITYVGFKSETASDVFVQLGDPSIIYFTMTDASSTLKDVSVSSAARKGAIISKDNKGTSTNINRRLLSSLPTLSRSITDFTKLTPQSNGTSFAGQDNRAINFTLDGSVFNNSFGLQPLNGSQTNSNPISLDAIEEIQVNVSPYNLRDAGFTGASINAVTKSGTNTIHGGAFYNNRNQNLTGRRAGKDGKDTIAVPNFRVEQYGLSLGGPIVKNKLFYYLNFEGERRTDPGTPNVSDASNGANPLTGNTTRVFTSDLETLKTFLSTKLNYNPGSYQGYLFKTQSDKGLAKIDYNINDKNKLVVRGTILKSKKDVVISNSNSRAGNRNSLTSMAFSNSAYEINNDIYSVVAQLNTRFSNRVSNEMIFGYTANRDYRKVKGGQFPTVDILKGGSNYISFGNDPFTPNNTLNTDTWQFSDNVTLYSGKHTFSAGISFEAFDYLNIFTPRINGIYSFNSLADFYTSANAFIANPTMTTNPVALAQYSYTYSKSADGSPWASKTEARNIAAYIQDQVDVNKDFNLTFGVRFEVPYFTSQGYVNPAVDAASFVDEKGGKAYLSTSKLPTSKLMISPRVGFNYDVNGDKQTQIRGGMGLFTGRPPFVFISNAVGNNGVQSGDVTITGTTAYPFTTAVPAHAPAGLPSNSYNIAPVDQDFRFPQVFRSNIAIDQKIGSSLVASAEFLFTQSISNVFYYNGNLTPAAGTFNGPDNRPRFGGVGLTGAALNAAIRLNPTITDATVLKSDPLGGSTMATFKLEKPTRANGFGWMVAYNFSNAKSYIDPSTIANSSWTANKSVMGNNNPDLAYSDYDVRNRYLVNLNYRRGLGKHASILLSLFGEAQNQGRASYSYQGDMNGDGVTGNDLIYIPKDQSEMNFKTSGSFTVQQQKDAFEAYINQDAYLSRRRGQYAERNGLLLPMLTRVNVSAALDLYGGDKMKHNLQLRADIFNVGNLINHNWGVGYLVNAPNNNILAAAGVDGAGKPIFTMNAVSNSLNYSTFRKGTSIVDVYQLQLGLRYSF